MDSGYSILIIDGGGRAHAISCAYERDPKVDSIIVAPRNEFIAYDRKKEVLLQKCNLNDPYSILAVAREHRPDLIEVAQEKAIACGGTDILRKNGFNVFGPTQKAARIEWDKTYSREFMQRNNIAAPEFRYFDTEASGLEYLDALYDADPDLVVYVKAAGLCAGKGALKGTNRETSKLGVKQMKYFGDAGNRYIIEKCIFGEEFSGYAISDGENYKMFKTAQDNKRSKTFDEGEQTGGMGAVSPSMITEPYMEQIEDEQIWRAINGMKQEGAPYQGILYLGGIIVDGAPWNIEYNARWGDPECQVVLPRVKNYFEVVNACINGRLADVKIEQDDDVYVGIVGASKGYPGDYSNVKGKQIFGLKDAMAVEGVQIFGAGIDVEGGKFFANGGRLFTVVGKGKNIIEAKRKAHESMATIHIEGNNLHYRIDIGQRDVERQRMKM